jgi:hypothetical protein
LVSTDDLQPRRVPFVEWTVSSPFDPVDLPRSDQPASLDPDGIQLLRIFVVTCLCGVLLAAGCVTLAESHAPKLDEALWLRFIRRCAEHPLRMMLVGSLLAAALRSGSVRREPSLPPEKPRAPTPL